jgi:hypothetical protein
MRASIRGHDAPLTDAASSCASGTDRTVAASINRRDRNEAGEIREQKHAVRVIDRPRKARPVPQADQTDANDGAWNGEQHDEENVGQPGMA